jgi:hypothetical protein
MALNSRNTRFFWVMLLLLVVAMYVGVMFVSTADKCSAGHPQKWQWVPPRWVCTNPGL